MEPRIQYAQTKDGVSIAFHTKAGGASQTLDLPQDYVQDPMRLYEARWRKGVE